MSALTAIRLLTVRELRERALRRTYLLGTAATLAVIVAAVALPALLGGDGPDDLQVATTADVPAELVAELEAALGPRGVATTEVADEAAATDAVRDEDADVALVGTGRALTDGPLDPTVLGALETATQRATLAERLQDAGIDGAELAAVTAPTPVELVDVGEDGDQGVATDEGFLLAFGLTLLLLVGVQMAGSALLSGALEEKTSRVVEVLVATARPWQLLTGKVLATSLLSLVQLGLAVAALLGTNAVVDAFTLPPATGRLLTIGVVMLLGGFLFYAALFTVAGTLAGSLEDAQSTATPLYVLMYGAYGAVFATVIPDPSGIVAQVLTFVPPTAPFVVPPRAAVGALPDWQLVVSVVLTFAGALVAVRVAGRAYAASLLSGGKRSWRDAWRAEPVR